MRDALREIVEAVTRRRLRAAATAFGVFWGIFMLTVLLAGGTGLRNGVYTIFAGNAINMAWIEAGRTSAPYQGLAAGRRLTLEIQDVAALASAVPELENLSPRQPLPPQLTLSYGRRSVSLPTHGIYETFLAVGRQQVFRGRAMNRLDVERARKVVLVGRRARQLLFGESDPIGERLSIGGVAMTVVGEFQDAGGEEEERRVYIPYTTFRQNFDSSPIVQSIAATVRPGSDEASVRARVMHLMARRHRFDERDANAVEVWFMAEEFKRVQKLLRGIDAAIVFVGLGSLVSGMVGVSNILFVSVRERAKEVGISRALGASGRSILFMVIAEALLLATSAGSLGLSCALVLVRLAPALGAESDFFKQPGVDLPAVCAALSVLVATALVAGYFPAREAARMTPIEALRRE